MSWWDTYLIKQAADDADTVDSGAAPAASRSQLRKALGLFGRTAGTGASLLGEGYGTGEEEPVSTRLKRVALTGGSGAAAGSLLGYGATHPAALAPFMSGLSRGQRAAVIGGGGVFGGLFGGSLSGLMEAGRAGGAALAPEGEPGVGRRILGAFGGVSSGAAEGLVHGTGAGAGAGVLTQLIQRLRGKNPTMVQLAVPTMAGTGLGALSGAIRGGILGASGKGKPVTIPAEALQPAEVQPEHVGKPAKPKQSGKPGKEHGKEHGKDADK